MICDEKKKILIVDDDRNLAEDLEQLLQDMGFQPIGWASTSEEAIQKTATLRPDVVLMDIILVGKKDGIETAERIYKKHNVPVIYLTAHADDATIQRAIATHPFGYVLKPFNERELRIVLGTALKQHALVQKVRRANLNYEEIICRLPNGILILNEWEKIIFINPVAQKLLNRHEEFVIHQFFDGNRENLDPRKIILNRDDKKEISLEVRVERLSRDGHVNFIMNVQDVTETQKRIEQVQQKEKMEALGMLAGGIAHDFNNLLSVILGNCEYLLGWLKDEDTHNLPMNEIYEAAKRASNLTNQLLVFSRRNIIQPKVIDLNTLVRGLLKYLPRLAGESIEIVSSLDEKIGFVKIDPSQMEQVLLNLVVNARDAMPEGGQIQISTSRVIKKRPSAPGAEQSRVKEKEYVRVTVRDEGCGITEEVREHIFELFFTTKKEGKGSGIGLATCYNIIKQAGGNIEVQSQVGVGTTFGVYLPCVNEPLDKATSPKQDKEIPKGTETVLIVEDDRGVRTLMAMLLRDLGYKVLEEQSSKTLMGKLEGGFPQKVDLLIADFVMPNVNGVDLAKRFLEIQPKTKILMISGYSRDALQKREGLDTHFSFLPKPFGRTTLAYKIREILDH